MENEEWRYVVGSSAYMVSSHGRVKSLARTVACAYPHTRAIKETILSTPKDAAGYPTCNVDGKKRRVHVLVAEAFIASDSGRPYINHIDGDKLNNRIDNLERVTPGENIAHAHKTGLMQGAIKPVFCIEESGGGVAYKSISYAARLRGVKKERIWRAMNNWRNERNFYDGASWHYI